MLQLHLLNFIHFSKLALHFEFGRAKVHYLLNYGKLRMLLG